MRKVIYSILIMCLAITLSACNNEDEAQNNNNMDQYLNVKDSEVTHEDKEYSNTEMAEHLADIAADVPGVNSATAVAVGPYSVVGIDVDKELDRSRVGTIKYSVSEALKQDIHGNNTMVTADGDVTERIRRLANKVRQGHPEDAIMDELSSIVGRYMPEVPQKENQPTEPDSNSEMLNDQKKKDQLDNLQNEQSNKQKNKNSS
ncbi:sporulation lipoprotein, YhcN/YlaJ family [Salinibacillus kushneri]|uniref:Sporulation lipoprotein, YhcN/YlaJ family n=1 Tax=Salinibacillus kushneri TaxID=237682 RepID=A0A1I0HR28_9BACI|nr:YhcN/YlaJ family sporulation lipoprotein [Salinibacillus kushneri]SET86457.1 sporulation lipoprotein, YhcN/YlaJ family [Salinibacillus kushneri]